MKYLFYTHSAITTRLCFEIIKYQNIDARDVLWLSARDEFVGNEQNVIPVEIFGCVLPKANLNFTRCRRELREWRRKLTVYLNGESYRCFLPQTQQLFLQLLTTHPLCKGYFLVEEGMAAYYEEATLTQIKRKKMDVMSLVKWSYNYINYGGSFRKRRLLQDSKSQQYLGCYTWNKYGFPGYTKRHVLNCPFSLSNEHLNVEVLIVLDAVVEAGMIKPKVMSKALNKTFLMLKKRGLTNLGVKLHPETTKQGKDIPVWWSEAFSGLKDHFSVCWIPRNCVVEDLALQKNKIFIVNISSVGLYAAILGRDVWSISGIVQEFTEGCDLMPSQMPSIWNKMIMMLK
mgnify:CR=1 FL=1